MPNKSRAIPVVLMLFLLALLPVQVVAQTSMSIARIEIAEIDYGEFPGVIVRAIIRDGNGDPVSANDADNLEMLEEDELVEFDFEETTEGVEVMFVLDAGKGVTHSLRNGRTRIEEMQHMLRTFTGSMGSKDSAGIVLVTPEGVSNPVPLTSDKARLESGMAEIVEAISARPPDLIVAGQDGIAEALDELDRSPNKGSVVQTIVFLSAGLQKGQAGIMAIYDRSNQDNVPIHVVLVNNDAAIPTTSGEIQDIYTPLKNIASATNGLHAHTMGEPSTSEVFDWLARQRTQHQFNFRSSNSTSSDRTVILRTTGGGAAQVSDSETYKVDLQPPHVVLESPENNEQISRKTDSYDADMDEVEPTTYQIIARVSWPDGYPRKITMARFWLNGAEAGSEIPFPGEVIQYNWDLRQYNDAGTSSAQWQAQVRDELGEQNTSEPVTAHVNVTIPPPPQVTDTPVPGAETIPTPPPPPEEECAYYEGVQYWICILLNYAGLIALGVALLALILVVVFRGRISGAAVRVGDAVRETVVRLTRPPQTEIGAYLNVLRGAEDLPRNRFPLYVNTVTPIGRDKRQAELVFDEESERSVVSRLHCEVSEGGGVFTIRDLGSTHGTFVNGNKLPELGIQELNNGDQIEIGPVERGGILILFEEAEEADFYAPPPEDDLPDRQTEPMV